MPDCLKVDSQGPWNPDGDNQICPAELDQWIQQAPRDPRGEDRLPLGLNRALLVPLSQDLEAGRSFLKKLSPASQASLLKWSVGDLRGLLYEALENPKGGYLPIDTRSFPPGGISQFPFFQDYVLLPEEVRPDLPDLAFEYIAKVIVQAAERVPNDRFDRFLDSLSPEAKSRLDPFFNGNLSFFEKLQGQMKHAIPEFDWTRPLSESDKVSLEAEFLSFDREAGLMKKEAFEILGRHWNLPLPSPSLVEIHLVTSEAAEEKGVPIAMASGNKIFLRLPGAQGATNLKAYRGVIHEFAHAVLEIALGPSREPPLPVWFHEAAAMEASGEIGDLTPLILSWFDGLSFHGHPPHPEPVETMARANYDFAEAFHAVWTEKMGPSAWRELVQEVMTKETDLYRAIAKVAERHGQSDFENESAVRQTVYQWIDALAFRMEMPRDAWSSYHQKFGGLELFERNFLADHFETFVDFGRGLFQAHPDLPQKMLNFIEENPGALVNVQFHALLMVRAFDANDPKEAAKHLQAIGPLLERYHLGGDASRDRLVKLAALAALMEGDRNRFVAALDSLVLPTNSFYAREINEELWAWRQRALEGDTLTLLDDFRKSLFPSGMSASS